MPKMRELKKWPADCVWPEPIREGAGGLQWESDDFMYDQLDPEGQNLLAIREYYDSLVEEGRLDEDYSLKKENATFIPEMGERYWNGGFNIKAWEEAFEDHVNLLKIMFCNAQAEPVSAVREITGYEFVNENLLRQAFTRRAFAVQYGLDGCGEELEFLGDAVLTQVVTKEIVRQLMEVDAERTEAPFGAVREGYDEGILSKIRSAYVSKEYLASRAEKLGLDRFILYGSGEEPTESSCEDMIEALIGAIAVDSGWNQEALDEAVDGLVGMQLTYPDRYLKATYYELFNAWHQKRFGRAPEYKIYLLRSESESKPATHRRKFRCSIRFFVPDYDRGSCTSHRLDVDGESRSEVREKAAKRAYYYVVGKGEWVNLKDAGVVPDLENSINQLQELYQKKYIEAMPQYSFESGDGDEWNCDCVCGGVSGYGRGISKTMAKKKAAYMVLVRLLESAGICEKSWKEKMWENL